MFLETLVQDVRYAVRDLRAAPLFSSVAILTLAVGIGATTAIFSTVNATLLRPLPYPRAGELVDGHTRLTDGRATSGLVSGAEIDALRRMPSVVAHASAVTGLPMDLTVLRDDGTVMPIAASGVAAGFFETLGLPMTLGRAFSSDEHVPSGREAPTSVIISTRLWTSMFGRDRGVIGRPLHLAEFSGASTIVGVASPDLDMPHGADAWINLRLSPSDGGHGFKAILRLQPGASITALESAGRIAMAELGRTIPNAVGREYVFQSLLASTVGDLRPTLLIVLGATALLLVLACINVTNLSLARGVARAHDVAMRSALGASPGRLVRQLLTQSMILSIAGAAAGTTLAFLAVRAFMIAGGSQLPRLETVPIDARVATFVIVAVVFTGIASGLAPAMRLVGTDVKALLADGSRRSTPSRKISRLMSAMVVAEVALAIALVAGAGWLIQSYNRLRATDAGFSASGRLVIEIRPVQMFRDHGPADAWSEELLNRVRATAGSAVVGSAWTYPLGADRDGTTNVELTADAPHPDRVQSSHMRIVSRGFFEAMGIRLLGGRPFNADDRRGTEPVIVVNRSFVRKFVGSRDPLATRIAFGYPDVDRQKPSRIIGVVDDVRYASLAVDAEPTFYIPNTQEIWPNVRQTVVVAPGSGDPIALVERIRAELLRFDPQLLLTFTAAPQLIDAATTHQQLGMSLMLAFGAAALLLAAVGVYGVIAYVASSRRTELATRMALGATRGHVFWLMMGSALRVALVGGTIGIGLAYAGGRLLASSVFGISAGDPFVLASAGGVVVIVAAFATLIPAIRVSRQDPIRALRAD
jgi:predicted permease